MSKPKLIRKPLALLRLLSSFFTPTQNMVLGYSFYILFTFLWLAWPGSWNVEFVHPLDTLFIASSVVSTTGLATVNVAEVYNFWGQLGILVGVQVSGLGYMTFSSFTMLAFRGRLSHTNLTMGKTVFAVPDQFKFPMFIKRTVLFTLGVEAIGAAGLYVAFVRAGAESPLWAAVFHSVSAFCTAGFSTFSTGLEQYHSDVWVNIIISILSLLGAIGFIVFNDVYLYFRLGRNNITLTSKIILLAITGSVGLGTFLLFFDPALNDLADEPRLMVAFFHATSAISTAGFNTYPLLVFAPASVMALIIMMILGAAPSGTGGGLKNTTWSAGIASIFSSLRGQKETTFWGNSIPTYRTQAALAASTMYLTVFVVGCFLLLVTDSHPFEDLVFEVASSLGTVGLSRNVSPTLTAAGKWVVIGLMFIGRVGVLSIVLATLGKPSLTGKEAVTHQTDLML